MEDDLTLPLSLLQPVDIRRVREPGIVLPIQPSDQTIAITLWDENPFALLLDGPHSFTFFQIDERSRFSGLFIPTPQVVVSVSSATRGEAVWQQRGTLILEGGRANVVGCRAGDHWGDSVNVPLWQEIDFQGAERTTVGFTQWCLRVVDGHEKRVVWRSQGQADQTE